MNSAMESPVRIVVRQQSRETNEEQEERLVREREEIVKDLPHSD